jgi:hypothetical protein
MAAILLSVKILGMTLCEATKTVYAEFVPIDGVDSEPFFKPDLEPIQDKHFEHNQFFSSFERDPIVWRLLERAGWCAYQVERCNRMYLSQGDLSLLYYMMRLDRRDIPGDHSNCTVEKCFTAQVDEENYETKHFMSMTNCDCDLLSLSGGYENDLVLDTVRKGGTPLLRREGNMIRIFRLGLDEGPPPPYCALSHVWAEGMGNPKQNALPWCMLKILQYSAERFCPGVEMFISGSTHFACRSTRKKKGARKLWR